VPARIVVVHDDQTFSDPLVESLRAIGLDVAAFADSMTAWDAIGSARKVEILVTRVHFGPDKPHGVALAHSVRARCPGVRVLFVAQPQFKDAAEDTGLFLPWPVSVPEVAEAVGRMLADDSLGRTGQDRSGR
jgi:DNA-binding NtrC family response regulator